MAKTHNLWHRAALTLEQMAFDAGLSTQLMRPKLGGGGAGAGTSESDSEPSSAAQQETLNALCDVYSQLQEEDLLFGLWQKRSRYPETNVALAYEQHGLFEQAETAYQQVRAARAV